MKQFLLLCFFLAYFCALSQTTWSTKINFDASDYLEPNPGLIKALDGNYIFLYDRYDDPPILTNSLTHAVAKFDTQGKLIWEKKYDHNEDIFGNGGLHPKGIVQMPDESFVVIGRVLLFSSIEAYIYVTDNEGDSLLYRTYPQYELFHKIARHNINEITVRAVDTLNISYFVKININSGDILSENEMPFVGSSRRLVFPNNVDYYFYYNTFSDSIRLEKYSSSGDLLLNIKFQYPEGFNYPTTSFGFSPVTNQTLNEEGIVIYDNAVIELDNNLNLTLGIPFNEISLSITSFLNKHECEYVLPTLDGGYLLSGTINSSGGDYDDTQVFFIKVNNEGEEEWSKAFPHWELPANYVPYILEESDGYIFIMHGYFNEQIYLVKMTNSGDLVATSIPPLYSHIDVSPNPCQETLYLSSSEFLNGTFRIYNLYGKQVQQLQASGKSHEIYTQNLSPGIYFLDWKGDDKKSQVLKFIKQ